MTQTTLFDRDEAIARRDQGIERVDRAPWKDRAFAALVRVARHQRELTADDVRAVDGLEDPHHPNAWGAVFMRAVRTGVIVNTGRTVNSDRPDAHRRRIPVYGSGVFGTPRTVRRHPAP